MYVLFSCLFYKLLLLLSSIYMLHYNYIAAFKKIFFLKSQKQLLLCAIVHVRTQVQSLVISTDGEVAVTGCDEVRNRGVHYLCQYVTHTVQMVA